MPELNIAGQKVKVPGGSTVLAAMQNAHLSPIRRSLTGEPRGALCGMGVCLECRALVNGQLVRTCLTAAQDGQTVQRIGGER